MSGLVGIGIALEVLAGVMLSFSLVIQRHALIHQDNTVPLGCCRLRRSHAWAAGIVFFVLASVVKIVGYNMGPITVLGSVFVGVVLVTNLVLGRWLLREELTPTKVVGSLFVLSGAVMCTAATPSGVPTSFTTADMRTLFERGPPFGGFYLGLILGIILLCLGFIVAVECTYPPPNALRRNEPTTNPRLSRQSSPFRTPRTNPRLSRHSSPFKAAFRTGMKRPSLRLRLLMDTPALHACAHYGATPFPTGIKRPSLRLRLLMVIVYPGSLGLNEAFVDACARGYSSMILRCLREEEGLASCNDWPLYLMMCVGIPAAIATGYWLKVVFARYQTTLALPIEYSMLNICAVGGGLLFYNEVVYMNQWQLPLVLAGCGVMTLGGFMIVAVGLREELRPKRGARVVLGLTTPPGLTRKEAVAAVLKLQKFIRCRRLRLAWYQLINDLRDWNDLVKQIEAARQQQNTLTSWPGWLWA